MAASSGLARQRLVVGFADLSRFLAASAGKDDLVVALALQRHYEQTGALLEGRGGRLIKLIGDAILFCFPAGRAEDAVACAREMQAAAAAGIARELGSDEVRLGVGLALGEVVAGEFGLPGRRRFD